MGLEGQIPHNVPLITLDSQLADALEKKCVKIIRVR